ncbi:MAG: hypothetical protein RL732_104 [Bacteroidota bacterium]
MVYLIPSYLHENTPDTLSPAVKAAVSCCQVFYVENERSARRYLKNLWKEMVIDDYEWVLADKETIETKEVRDQFLADLRSGKNIGILSEAGCPGVADPGQYLVSLSHQQGFAVKPLVGPSSILLALMASGLNGQQFCFRGYLPIESSARLREIRNIEQTSSRQRSTEIFMETPYRNQALFDTLLNTCRKDTMLCIAANLTAPDEFIHTCSIEAWAQKKPDLHKKPALFLLLAQG